MWKIESAGVRSLVLGLGLGLGLGAGVYAQVAPEAPPPFAAPAVSAILPAAPATSSPVAPSTLGPSEGARLSPVVPPPSPAEVAPLDPMIEDSETAAATSDASPLVSDTASPPIALPRDLSPWGMFLAADIVVKSIMVGLAIASLVTWTIWIAKNFELVVARSRLGGAVRTILDASDLETADLALAGKRGPAAQMVRCARREADVSVAALADAGGRGLLQRVTSHLGRIEAQAGRRLGLGTGLLATIGATAPFVGLFGTVWGIMNAFIGISESQTTNLAVVAPGIAEALLATALGLVAAIPAVIIYNSFARSISSYRARLADAAAGIERLVSRDLDHRRLAGPAIRRAAE